MDALNLRELEALAAARLDPAHYDYYRGGAGDEQTLRENEAAWSRLRLRPRALVDVARVELATTLLGAPASMPVVVAPLAYQRLADPEGEPATARAAAAAGVPMAVSTLATTSLEDVAAAAPGAPRWFQLYMFRDRGVSASLCARAEAAGYGALVLTVDTPRLGRRERDVRNGFGLPAHLRNANFADAIARSSAATPRGSGLARLSETHFDDALTWDALAWLRAQTRLPLVLKGIVRADDARLAAEHGVAGVVVSNHGGRQLDGAVATAEALPEVVEAVDGRCEVYVDGGVRRGVDVLRALALGARGVLVGRPVLWGLAAAGEAGVRRVLELLRGELELALALAGAPHAARVDPTIVAPPRR
ncbi:MAG TPA: alpha-hydroxy acid oxidase [Polyangiaceae bacterium]|nr:alpha-hydroxy acid oxidase [Polyangiaceae bacterium]